MTSNVMRNTFAYAAIVLRWWQGIATAILAFRP